MKISQSYYKNPTVTSVIRAVHRRFTAWKNKTLSVSKLTVLSAESITHSLTHSLQLSFY